MGRRPNGQPNGQPNGRPNVLLMIADDHRYSAIRAFGDHVVRTPGSTSWWPRASPSTAPTTSAASPAASVSPPGPA